MKSRKVFIVHGHEEALRHSVETLLRRLNLEPVVLRDRPNSGRTILEKFQEEAHDAGYAIVLLTPDDEGRKAQTKGALRGRARQNVIFEFGYFVAALGGGNVAALMKGEVEKPSDILGVTYIEADRHGDWKRELARELHSAGYGDIEPSSSAITSLESRSYPLSLSQCRELIAALSWGTRELLRETVSTVRPDGVATISWGRAKQLLEIESWSEFRGPRTGLSKVLRRLTNDKNAELIWWIDDEWPETDDDYEASSPLYIDGRAVEVLRQAFASARSLT